MSGPDQLGTISPPPHPSWEGRGVLALVLLEHSNDCRRRQGSEAVNPVSESGYFQDVDPHDIRSSAWM